MTTILNVQSITKRITTGATERVLFTDISFAIKKAEFVALGGRSGSGKSTLLNIIAGIDLPDSGNVQIAGTALADLSEHARSELRLCSLGLVFQFFHLLPTMSLRENILLPALLRGTKRTVCEEKADAVISRVGIQEVVQQYPHQVSGGEAQRAAIARALINDPVLLLADEPTGNLDWESAESILDLLKNLQATTGITILMVTHEEAVMRRADRRLELRQGSILP